MDAKSIRESAERRRKYVNGDDADWSLLYEMAEADDDTMDLADAYLAEHPADDGDGIDDDWMLAAGFQEDPNDDCRFVIAQMEGDGDGKDDFRGQQIGMLHVANGEFVCEIRQFGWLWSDSIGFGKFRTRGDIRRLCKVLGITLKEAK